MAKPAEITEFSGEGYRAAAAEHVTVASELYDLKQYVLANYVAGVATECIFRAYRHKIDPEFDARHDLLRLYKISKFVEVVPAARVEEYAAHVGTVAVQWSNNHRYRAEKALRTYLKRAQLDRGMKGDFLKELTRRCVNAATEIVIFGVQKWPDKL